MILYQQPRTVHSVSDDERGVEDGDDHDEGEEEQIEHVNLQNSVRSAFFQSKMILLF